jgi:hypothetical protein
MFPGELDDAGTSNKGYLRLVRPEQQWPSGIWVSELVGQWTAPGCVQDIKAVWHHIAIAVDYGVSASSRDVCVGINSWMTGGSDRLSIRTTRHPVSTQSVVVALCIQGRLPLRPTGASCAGRHGRRRSFAVRA